MQVMRSTVLSSLQQGCSALSTTVPQFQHAAPRLPRQPCAGRHQSLRAALAQSSQGAGSARRRSRRLAYAALQMPRIRYWEKEFSKLTDAEILKQRRCSCAAGPAAASRWTSCCPRCSAWSAWPPGAQCGMRPFDVQLAAGVVLHHGRPGRAGHRRRQDADRHPAGRPQRPGRQGRPRHHGQRLPGPPRRRVDRADLHGPSA